MNSICSTCLGFSGPYWWSLFLAASIGSCQIDDSKSGSEKSAVSTSSDSPSSMGTSEGVEGSKSHVDDGGSYGLVPLVDESGSLIKLQDFLGKPLIVFFGYASCSSVCPTSLAYMAQELDSLGEDRKRVTPMFISVDTNVDSPDKIRNFIRQFAPDIKGVTGSEEHIQRMVAAFKPLGGYYSNTDSSGKHSQAHFQSFVLVDAKGQITGMLAPPFEKGALAKYISTHLKWTGPNGP